MSIKRTIITAIVGLTLVAVVAPGVAQGVTVQDLLNQMAQLQAQLSALQGGSQTSGTGACAGITFTRNLTVGSSGSDVKCLQVILNQSSTTQVSTTGAGSPGYETMTFGPKTLAAVRKYQVAQGFTPANQVGPLTRARLNAALGAVVTPGNPPVVTPTGSISAMLALDTPSSGAIIASQATADLLHINFSGSGVVTSVTLQRSGISDQNVFTNVYLFDGNQRITDGYSFNASSQIVMNGLNIVVNGSHTISVRADVEGTVTTQASVAVALVGFTANGTAGTASVQGNTFTIVTGSAASATITAAASVAVPAASVNAGTTGYTFWSAPVQISTRAVLLKTANFRMVGSAPIDALSNIHLFVDGVDTGKVATVVTINGSNYASFDLTSAPITLTTGSHTVDVRADIQKGTNRDVTMSVQQASDLTITDPQVGVNIAVSSTTAASFSANSAGKISISQGSATVTVDPTFTSATNIASGATNAVIGRFIIHAYGEDMKVSTLNVKPLIETGTAGTCTTDGSGVYSTGSCGGINNVTLYFNGSQVGSQTSQTYSNAGSTIPFTLGSQMIAPAGQDSVLEVRADLQTSGGVAWTIGTVVVSLDAETTNAQGMSSQATTGIPSTATSTTGLTISTGTVALSSNNAYSAQTISPNTTGVKIGSYTIQNQSTSEAVRLTQIKVVTKAGALATPIASYTSTDPDISDLSAIRTSDTTGNGSVPQPSTATTGLNTFSVNDTLAPGASMTIDVFANIGSKSEGTSAEYAQTALQVTSIGVVDNTAAYTPSSSTYTSGQIITLGVGTMSTPTLVVSSTTPSQYIASATGATNASQASFNIVSTSGSATINDLKFLVTDSLSGATVSKVCVGTACGTPIQLSGDSLYYVDLPNLSLVVPNGGGGLTFNAQVSYPAVGTGGIANVSNSLISLAYVKYNAGGTLKALGNSGQCTAYTSPTCTPITAVAAKTLTLVGSVPTVVVPSTVASGLVNGIENQIGQVTITANPMGAIKISTLTFNVGVSGYTSGPVWANPRLASGSTTISGITCAVTTQGTLAARSVIQCTPTSGASYANDYLIGAGQSQTFNLYATINGSPTQSGSSTESVSTALASDTSSTYSANAKFMWDDTASNGLIAAGTGSYGDANTGTGLNSALIYNFPTNSYTIHQ